MTLQSLPGERWADIPGLEGYGMISNLGRVKRLPFSVLSTNDREMHYGERIQTLKQTRNYNGFKQDYKIHLNCRIQVEGVSHSISVGRIVYHQFVEKFDLSNYNLYVTYKDGNGLNPVYTNLELVDQSGLQQKIIRSGRKDLHFGHSLENQIECSERSRQLLRKKVHQYDLNGNYITTYDSLSEAASVLGLSLAAISAAANGRTLSAGNYIWRSGAKRKKIAVEGINKARRANKGTEVSSYDLKTGVKIETYYNITRAARELKVERKFLSDVVNGKVHSYANTVWRKGDQPRIDTTDIYRRTRLHKGLFPLSSYDLKGKKVKTFESAANAAKALNIDQERLNAMATHDDMLLDNVIWRYGDGARLPAEELARIKKSLTAQPSQAVTQYDLAGKRIATFKSVKEAVSFTGISDTRIRAAVNGYKATCAGYLWRKGSREARLKIPKTPRPLRYNPRGQINQYSLKGKKIASFSSINEAARATGIHFSTIGNAIRNNSGKAGGYLWERIV
ncbi:NUMOD1 domain-containing DNA-binding protein [Chitinophaga sp. RCC_12]|uniref:NUMOD1 domain-containing DNA-binding protein n=1 Tax=Chitinophaga sp. RCC_12 TaxID=3239226 RepID=UPI0035260DDF